MNFGADFNNSFSNLPFFLFLQSSGTELFWRAADPG